MQRTAMRQPALPGAAPDMDLPAVPALDGVAANDGDAARPAHAIAC